eukprot:303606-Chlamydomonas_euryale.AAC.1
MRRRALRPTPGRAPRRATPQRARVLATASTGCRAENGTDAAVASRVATAAEAGGRRAAVPGMPAVPERPAQPPHRRRHCAAPTQPAASPPPAAARLR